jgi:hypothetical protein
MRALRAAIIVSSLVMGAVVGLGEAAGLLERSGTVPFDGDGTEPVAPTGRSSRPFESRAA